MIHRFGGLRLMAAGVLLLQLAWLFAVPPFRGSDEFDHAYRAASVARGDWAPDATTATRGTGAFVVVPENLVEAARPECQRLPYTTDADCVGEPAGDGSVRAATGAGRYHPLFYELVGAPALPFDGTTALYVMRITAALLCWGVFVLGLATTRTWARTRWPFVALATASTPVLLYSTVIPAPNGLEMVAGLALWSALIGVAERRDRAADRLLLAAVTLSAGLLVTLRSFGPVWCGLALLTVLLAVRTPGWRIRELLGRSRGWVTLAAVVAFTVASLAWITVMGSLVVGKDLTGPVPALTRLTETAENLLLWVFQSIAAFPFRDENAPPAVYAFLLLLAGWLLVVGLRRAGARLRWGIVVAAALTLLVPAVVTFQTYETFGTAWQGRYTLPYAVGTLLLVGLALDRNPPLLRPDLALLGGVLLVGAHAASIVDVALRERGSSPGVADGTWVLVPPVLLGVVACIGAGALWCGSLVGQDDRQEVADDRPDRTGRPVRTHR